MDICALPGDPIEPGQRKTSVSAGNVIWRGKRLFRV
jgi:hypothetical protein